VRQRKTIQSPHRNHPVSRGDGAENALFTMGWFAPLGRPVFPVSVIDLGS
jgi:hypothetical protein